MKQQKYKIGDIVRCTVTYLPYDKQNMIVQIFKVLEGDCVWTHRPYTKPYHIKVIAGPKQAIGKLMYVDESHLQRIPDEELTLILLEK